MQPIVGHLGDNTWSPLGRRKPYFLIGTVLFTTKEYSPRQFAEFANEDPETIHSSKFSDIFKDFARIPAQMKKLGAVQFFSWFALFTMWVFTTSALATHHFGLSPEDMHSKAFNNAGDLTGKLFGMYNLWAIPFAFLLTPLAKTIGKKQTHALALLCGGLGLISMYFYKRYRSVVGFYDRFGFCLGKYLSDAVCHAD